MSQINEAIKALTLSDIQQHAKDIGLADAGKLNQTDLIHAIQTKEGHQPCFGASWCNPSKYEKCPWKESCRAIKFYI